ncbi:beta-phosphoglucomutase family hydrolase [Nocardioides sp. dk4132]|uniref:HAD family hydrolase n=1 Tax=unclassified Nocardioides TaxID=2615069 RepID=UPI001296BE9D|nr:MULTISPECIES: beta-phosphoglucomutase family hydrolase [unclassified Nocardioides]MQW75246.1 beta-phosphoglucomutase family hydrolase [Nocardioides sp. dk4132]QGA07602.1 beta-phosphoglucomutase family hydrolase [Nocardioides sp. dk884]
MDRVDWTSWRAVLFDLDGVVTPTAEVHMRAWSEMFNAFLTDDAPALPDAAVADLSVYTDADYFAHVDGKPRYDGVRDFLVSRGITLPEGTSEDPGTELTVRGLGNRKNDAFNAVLERDGVTAYPGSVALLDHLRDLGIPLAVVSSSANAPAVLAAAGLADRFRTVVDGRVATELGLPGKPAPDTFVHAAEVLGAPVAASVVLEDAVSGVRAGAAGGFGLVIGVDRGAGPETLTQAGADLVVTDLAELVAAVEDGAR